MNDLVTNSKSFLKRNSANILTYVGAIGVVATAISAVKATPKAIELINDNEEVKGRKLTKSEVIRMVGPLYIPSVLIGTSTIACIFGINIMSKRQQASLVGLYSLLDSSYNEYKEKVKEEYGDDADQKITKAIAIDHYDSMEFKEKSDEIFRFFDYNSMRFFESTFDDLHEAEALLNKILTTRGNLYLDEYHGVLGIYSGINDYESGWTSKLMSEQDVTRIELLYEKVKTSSGEEFYILTTSVAPILMF